MLHVHNLDNRELPPSAVDRAMRRRDLIGRAFLVALGLTSSDASRHRVDAAKREKKQEKRKKGKKGKNKQGASSSGREVVRVAQKYKGARYTWGGASPKGFDCSGFTWYVYQKATGMDITRGVEEQWRHGRSVSHGAWQPGDIVFFENTFERGLSHVGIYMSGDNFIHAENEQTGVVVSSLESEYYSKHYAGARRLL
ncbi:MAG: cell wall-associated hydrolase [Thermomicrobiales bacterium]|nr:cell wall-associated hydrolase [Thermomicrobiales bacterium]